MVVISEIKNIFILDMLKLVCVKYSGQLKSVWLIIYYMWVKVSNQSGHMLCTSYLEIYRQGWIFRVNGYGKFKIFYKNVVWQKCGMWMKM